MLSSYLLLLTLFQFESCTCSADYTFFSDSRGVGIRDNKGEVCLLLLLNLEIINHNLGPEATKESLDVSSASLGGYCSTPEKPRSQLNAALNHLNRTRTLKFYFNEANIVITQYEELRWQLYRIVYTESYAGQKVQFHSPNGTSFLSGPLKQKFTCRDVLNVTLSNVEYQDVQLFLNAPLEVQPFGLSSNIYLCERTRKRTLSQSLEMKSTIFSGVVLLLSSIGVIIGHTLRRHFMPERKQLYDNLG